MRNLYSLGKNGPKQPTLRKPEDFLPKTKLISNTAINSFAENGLFYATNIMTNSGNRAINQMIKDSNIIKK